MENEEKNGTPVYVSMDCLSGETLGKSLPYMARGGYWIVISTLAGEKKVGLYHGNIEVDMGQKSVESEVYFAPTKNMIGREYAVLIHARIIEGQAENYAID